MSPAAPCCSVCGAAPAVVTWGVRLCETCALCDLEYSPARMLGRATDTRCTYEERERYLRLADWLETPPPRRR